MTKKYNQFKKIVTYLVIISITLVVLGFSYEQISRQIVINKYPVQGQLVDLGNGQKMQIDCRRNSVNNNPTVILESGFDSFGSLSWTKVQDQISKDYQVCSYSRAGVMWSDDDSKDYNADNVANNLNLLLKNAKITNPIIIVAHSLGGPLAMQYVQKYPDQVKGLVFVDTSHPDEIEKSKLISKEYGMTTEIPPDPPNFLIKLGAELGLVRLFNIGVDAKAVLPNKESQIADAYFPQTVEAISKQSKNIEKIILDSGSFRQLGNRPLINLSSARVPNPTPKELEDLKMTKETFEQFWAKSVALKRSLIADRNSWSTNSKSVEVPDADHYIQLDNPEIIIKSINEIVESVKNGTKL
jgi:pimeloyl-ACP methyl ester carboxylesterase